MAVTLQPDICRDRRQDDAESTSQRLACPDCHLAMRPEGDSLVCRDCGFEAPVRHGRSRHLVDRWMNHVGN